MILLFFSLERADQSNKAHSNYQVYDVELEEIQFTLVHKFSFLKYDNGTIRAPKKLFLSPNRQLLCMFGIHYRGQSCFVMYPFQSFEIQKKK
jgi:hypothetical protein